MSDATSLDRKLDHYSTTARGQLSRGRSAAEMAGYAAAAGATLAMAGTADAAIIYSGVQNVSVAINPAAAATTNATSTAFFASTSIDIDGGGADVYAAAGLYAAFNPANPAASFKYLGFAYAGATGGATFLGAPGLYGAPKLATGALIGPSVTYSTSVAGNARFQIYSTGAAINYGYGDFAPSSTGFVGIQLASGNFGWIRLHVADLGPNQPFGNVPLGQPFPVSNGLGFPDQVTIIDWAYQDDGTAIRAGAGVDSLPEPSSLGLLAMGAAGIAAMRRRKSKKRAD